MTSAAGYSDRLSEYSNKGILNLRDAPDPPTAVLGKVKALADLIRRSPHTVLHSGAGLSTSAGIADFRGPSGVWTIEKRNSSDQLPAAPSVSFESAVPTLAHMAICALYRAGHLQYVVSQNVDALHLRSGIPRSALSELHGNLFIECCLTCAKEYLRDYQTSSVGFQTVVGHLCTCGCDLTDKALDWEDNLPELDLERAEDHSRRASLAIVVGSSCQMTPARNLPFRSRVKASKAALVNLSKTKLDDRFAMRVRASCDTVFALLVDELGLALPVYERRTSLQFSVRQQEAGVLHCRLQSAANVSEADNIGVLESVTFSVKCSRPPGENDEAGTVSTRLTSPPYSCSLATAKSGAPVEIVVHFHDGGNLSYTFSCMPGEQVEKEVKSASKDYSPEVQAIVREARAAPKRGAKRVRPPEADVWFSRANARGYVMCVACNRDVASTRKRKHVTTCSRINAE